MDLFLYGRDLHYVRVKSKELLMLTVNNVQNDTHCSISTMEATKNIPLIHMKKKKQTTTKKHLNMNETNASRCNQK